MDVTWISVADTAVKIGLGALIAGGFAYLHIRINYSIDRRKLKSQYLREILLDVAEKSDLHFNALNKCYARIDGLHRNGGGFEKLPQDFIDNYLEHYDKPFIATRDSFSNAITRLYLIGADDTAKILNEVRGVELLLRNPIVFEHKFISKDDLLKIAEKFGDVMKRFRKSLYQLNESTF